jgi:signal transduction histidine kinase
MATLKSANQQLSNDTVEESKEAYFTVDSALLEELGERLVSRPEVALAELIKNAFDADSAECRITISSRERLLRVADLGMGMTEDKFLTRWMSIGTQNKAKDRFSEKYQRAYAGSKGVGRFAARFLGDHLTLTSVAIDPEKGVTTTLRAKFDWSQSTQSGSLQHFIIPYSIAVTPNAPEGTTLEIRGGEQIPRLNSNIKEVNSTVFKLTNPLEGLERPPFYSNRQRIKGDKDPGFSIVFEGGDGEDLTQFRSLQSAILSRFVARTRIEAAGSKAHVTVEWRDKGVVFDENIDLKDFYPGWKVDSPIFADIRYFPRRAGVFQEAAVDGRQALNWLRDNGGVAVVDNQFRVSPYGESGDDWLGLARDAARNTRHWQSKITSELFPMPPTALVVARDNPMLYLPQNSQLVGAVFVAPRKDAAKKADSQLIQAINRQGYLENPAFDHVRDLARFAVEIIAHHDHKFARDQEETEYRAKIKSARGDIASAIRDISKSGVISAPEKERLVSQLRTAQTRVVDAEQYSDTVRNSLEQMSLLGVLAGFLTHEFEKTLFRLESALSTLRRLARQHADIRDDVKELAHSKQLLGSYLEYARLFTEAIGENITTPFDARAQIELVVQTLDDFKIKHDVEVEIDGSEDLEIHDIPIAAYSGIVMNLVANAFKALAARSDKAPRRVLITASVAGDRHVLTVSDSGIGIPLSLRSRIWDPLYSTTRKENTSLGSGMGLGLTLVRRVVQNLGGKVEALITPSPGFSTTFRVDLPMKKQ